MSVLTSDRPGKMSAARCIGWGCVPDVHCLYFCLWAFHIDEGVNGTSERSDVMLKPNVEVYFVFYVFKL